MSMTGGSTECEWLQHDGSAERKIMRVSRKVVAIKLCGHCSPRRDMMDLAEELKGSAEELSFEFYAICHSDADILLILNACESACAERPPFDGPVITVTPETVDHWPVEKIYLAAEILSRIRKLFTGAAAHHVPQDTPQPLFQKAGTIWNSGKNGGSV